MNVLMYLVPMALLLGLIGLVAFLWSLKSGQYDDLEGAALRILPDDDIEALEQPEAEATAHDGSSGSDAMLKAKLPAHFQHRRVLLQNLTADRCGCPRRAHIQSINCMSSQPRPRPFRSDRTRMAYSPLA